MTSERNNEIIRFIERLTKEIAAARELSLVQTVHLLEIAKLDLTTIVHEISDEELRDFTNLVAESHRVDWEVGSTPLRRQMTNMLREHTRRNPR